MKSRLQTLVRLILITEGRKDDVKAQFPDVNVEVLAANDPSGNFKYLQWMAKQVSQGANAEDVISVTKQFHGALNRMTQRDINRHTMESIKAALEQVSGPSNREKKVRSAAAKNFARDAGKLVYEDDEIRVLYMSEPEACVYHGKDTKWCIASNDGGTEAWNMYRGDGERETQFYFVIRKHPKGDPFDKVAIDFATFSPEDSDEDEEYNPPAPIFYNAIDDEVTYKTVVSHIPSVEKAMKILTGHAPKQPAEIDRILAKYGVRGRANFWTVLKLISEKSTEISKSDLKFLGRKFFSLDYSTGLTPEIDKFLKKTSDQNVRSAIWEALPEVPARMLSGLYINDENPVVKKLANIAYVSDVSRLKDKEAKHQIIKSYVESPDIDIRREVSRMWYLTEYPAELEKLTYDKDPIVRHQAAYIYLYDLDRKEGSIPAEQQRRFAFDPEPRVRSRLIDALNISVSSQLEQELIRVLSKDESPEVRRQLTFLSYLPRDVRDGFETDPDPEVRKMFIRNLDPAPDTLKRMTTQDPAFEVRTAAADKLRQMKI